MKRRDVILGSAALLVPVVGRWVVSRPPSLAVVAGDPSPAPDHPTSQSVAYTTNFPLSENPINEGGRWINGEIFGKTDVQTTPGKAYGTMVSFNGSQFIDSCACLRGFGPDHEVLCTISNSGAVNGLEVEILLRAEITSAHVFLYELDCVYADGGIHLVRWDVTKSNPNSFTVLRKSHTVLRKLLGGEVSFSDGDQVYAKIVGTVVTCRYKLVGDRAFSDLFTYDTALDPVRHSRGNPGIGFWNETGSASNQSKFAWSSFTANTL
jgi:hypothetical protein